MMETLSVQLIPFGRTAMQVSPLGLGGAEIGFAGPSQATVNTLFDIASAAGINVIDTAAMYADSEEKIGRALQHRRHHFLLFTKCGRHPPRRGIRRIVGKARKVFRRLVGGTPLEWQPDILAWNIDESLRRMRTDHIDLIQLHSCSASVLRCAGTIEALERARRAGKVRYIGYAGDGEPLEWAIRSGRFDAVQLSVNVADQAALAVIPGALERGIGVIAKRPIANALWRHPVMPQDETMHVYWNRLRELNYDFCRSATSIATALQFTLSTGVHTAIVGTARPEHLRANAQMIEQRISPDEYTAICSRWKQVVTADWVPQT